MVLTLREYLFPLLLAIVLHALSSGFNVEEPATAPVAFFNFFHGVSKVSYRGLFAPAYVKHQEWNAMCKRVGVRESFAEKKKIQIIITALASKEDDHGELNRFIKVNAALGRQVEKMLNKEGRRGDVIYRPFNDRGPITRRAGIRAVTLYELSELVKFAADAKKAVILVAGPCGGCRRSRSDALLPLLTEPDLDVWSHLVTDEQTASECLASSAPSRPASA